MNNEVTVTGNPEVNVIGLGVDLPPAVEGSFSGRREDYEKDMALIAKEMSATTPTDGPTPLAVEAPQEPKQPEQPEAKAPVTVEQPKVEDPAVPEKFKAQDGSVDIAKLAKSFLEAEKALKREQNKNRQATAPTPTSQEPQNPPAGQVQNEPSNVDISALSQFEINVARDIYNGGGFSEQQAIALARVQVKLAEAQHQASVRETVGRVQHIEEFAQEQAIATELKAIRDKSPEIFSPQGVKELTRIRAENPGITSWTKAYVHYLGEQQFAQVAGGNPVLPTPKAATAPMVPVAAGSRPTAAGSHVVSGDDLSRMLANMTPEQENEFWKKNVAGARPMNRVVKK